jgi:3-oxoacyl-[acyl-carrier protein] reductase
MKKVLVTGASIGIGRATAIEFAKTGATVVINYRAAEEDARETLALVEKAGGQGYLMQADVSDEAQAEKLVFDAAQRMGGLDVLVNNAGVTKFIPFEDLDAATGDVWDHLYRTNVESIFFCTRAASKVMKPARVVINLASISGMGPWAARFPTASPRPPSFI